MTAAAGWRCEATRPGQPGECGTENPSMFARCHRCGADRAGVRAVAELRRVLEGRYSALARHGAGDRCGRCERTLAACACGDKMRPPAAEPAGLVTIRRVLARQQSRALDDDDDRDALALALADALGLL